MIYYNQGKGNTEREVKDMANTKTYKKKFEYRGQQINYYNKVKNAVMYITAEGKKMVEYTF